MTKEKMNLREVPFDVLPQEIQLDDAFSSEHADTIAEATLNLRNGRNVLFRVDRRDAEPLYRVLRKTMTKYNFSAKYVDGNPNMQAPIPLTGIQRMVEQIQENKALVNDPKEKKKCYEVVPHLDTIVSLGHSAMSDMARNIIAFFGDTSIPICAFIDPTASIPEIILKYFQSRYDIRGIRRETLPRITTQRFARCLSGDHFDALGLHSYVSGMSITDFHEMQTRIIDQGFPELKFGSDDRQKIYKLIHSSNKTSKFENPNVKFSDIAGYEEVKTKLEEEVFLMQKLADRSVDEKEYDEYAALIPRGIIFEGPPGTGKTLFASAIATIFGANITIIPASSLMNMYVGESERGIREVFEAARKQVPAVIVFDEIDAFASQRGNDEGGGGVKHSMVNTLLTELDGFANNKGILVIATTNFIESIDGALLRPSRFGLKIRISEPNSEDRLAILKYYRRKYKLVDQMTDEIVEYSVSSTEGMADYRKGLPFTGDHLYNLIKGLKRLLLRKELDGIKGYKFTHDDIDATLRPSYQKKIELSSHERITICIHESGHAIMALLYPQVGKISEITISQSIPGALGYVKRTRPENDKSMTRTQFQMLCRISFGGKAAEEVIFGEGNHSIGVSRDLEMADAIAKDMHYVYGMSKNGTVLGTNPSHNIKSKLDAEIAAFLCEEYEKTKKMIKLNKALLEKMSRDLIQKEVIKDTSEYIPVFPERSDTAFLETNSYNTMDEAFHERDLEEEIED